MKILFATSEVVPFASTGGLGDVAAALPKALLAEGVEVFRVMPLYGCIDRAHFGITPTSFEFEISLGTEHRFRGSLWEQEFEGVKTYFIQSADFFDRAGIYGHGGHGFEDNFERFLFFQKAIVHWIDAWNLAPDFVHANDWQTGLLPMFLQHGIHGSFRGGTERTLFTIHNLAHQGWAPAEKFYMTQLPPECYTMHSLEFYGEINTLKGGLVAATAINTVSPTYAQEIQTPEFGCKLDGVLRERNSVLSGILNGIDYVRWNPETDIHLLETYSIDDLSGKKACKRQLQEVAGFSVDPSIPLLGVITRLVPQKGIDLLIHSMERMMEQGVQFVLLGTGDHHYERTCLEWMNRWPGQVHAWLEFSSAKAHRIEAATDLFLMPSAFEPCGQNQLYSMRYGTIPVVHGVGGLEDTVMDAQEPHGTGFKFYGYCADNFFDCLLRGLDLFSDSDQWAALVHRAMEQDFSVVHMAKEYIALYRQMLDQ